MDALELVPVIEALLFSAAEPLTATQLAEACEADPLVVAEALTRLKTDCDADGRGIRLVEEAQGWLLVTRPDFAPYVGRLLRGRKKMRLSRPALETLAIIAYKQPVTKAEVDAIRGVDSSGVLNTLLERELVTIRGRSKVIGRPLLYGTTGEFLSYFDAMGYPLLRAADYPRIDAFIAALTALEEIDLLDPVRLERAVGEAERFYLFLSELFEQIGQRDELKGIPFDRRQAAEALKLYLGD